jgi:hypothetical protein
VIADHLRTGGAPADVLPDKLPTIGVPATEGDPSR